MEAAAYDPNKYTVGKLEPGTKAPGIIIEIEVGKHGDFVTQKYVTKAQKDGEKYDANAAAINVVIQGMYENEKFTVEKTMRLPNTKFASGKSDFGKWIMKYGRAPNHNQQVELMVDAEGYWKVHV